MMTNPFFEKSYVINRRESLPADIETLTYSHQFMLLASFHDAKLLKIAKDDGYGKQNIVFTVDFKGNTSQFQKGYRKFCISLFAAEIIEEPDKLTDLHILALDCVQNGSYHMLNMELAYFVGNEEHITYLKSTYKDIEVTSISNVK